MRLLIDTSRVRFSVAKAAEEKKDKFGNPRRDRKTQAPMFGLQLIARHDSGATVIPVTVVGKQPKVTEDQVVSVVGLEAVPWQNDRKELAIAYRAEDVVAVSPTGKS